MILMDRYSEAGHINVGSGEELSIRELAEKVATAVGFKGELKFDSTRPDGTPRKIMDNSRMVQLGWKPQIPLAQGIAAVYEWYLKNLETARKKG